MAKLATISDGDDTVDLIDATSPGISVHAGGFGPEKLNPAAFGQAGMSSGQVRVSQRWKLLLQGSSHDNATTQIAAFIDLLRKAWRYHNDPRYIKPVYLSWKTDDETGTRYALVYDAAEMSIPDLLNNPFAYQDIITNMGLQITRGVWRSDIPGVQGSAITMTATDGPASPTLVHIANHQGDEAIDTIYVLDEGAVGSVDFELGSSQSLTIADNADLSTGDIDFFWAGQVKLESKPATYMGIAGKGIAAQWEWTLGYENVADRFEFKIRNPAGASLGTVTADDLGSPAVDTEYFIVCWHDATANTVNISINDGNVDSVATGGAPTDGTGQFGMGERTDGAQPYDGTLKAAGFGKEAPAPSLITSFYNGGTPKFYADLTAAETNNLKAYWEFMSGALLTDSHGSNDLTNNNAATQVGGTAKSWSADHGATAAHDLFPSTPAVGDIYYIGGDEPFFNVVFNIGTAAVYTSVTLVYEYSDGNFAWPDMVLGDDLSLYPDDEPWNATGAAVLNFMGNGAWLKDTVNGDSKFWIRIRITALNAFTTPPANATDVVYNQKKNYVEIPNSVLGGDVPALIMHRFRAPAGGDGNPEMTATSLIVMGSKSRNLTKFQACLNLGNDGLPGDWASAAGTDGLVVADGEAPGGDLMSVTFATDETMVNRARLTGTAILDSWVGLFRVFLRCQQVLGSAGDLEVKFRAFINSTDAFAPKIDGPDIPLKGVDQGWEIVDMFPNSVLQIPFIEIEDSDVLTSGDLYFDIMAKRTAGAATLELADIILIPADEYGAALVDPISDETNGNSALRGLTMLDDDSGLVANRTIKQMLDGASTYPAETWSRRGSPPALEPALQTRLYFLLAHYPSGGSWGDEPLIGSLGMHLTYEMFKHNAWLFLRGSG